MNIADLAELPLAQRLQGMEVLWASLERDARQSDAIPEWHEEVVSRRLAAQDNGREHVKPWAQAKRSIHVAIDARHQALNSNPDH